MVDLTAIQGAITGLKAAKDITQAMVSLRDTAMIQGKVIELNDLILAAQSSAIDAKLQQTALLEQISTLETKVTNFENWETQKGRYQMQRLEPGVLLYALNPAMAAGEPAHYICPNCYEQRKRSLLHSHGNNHGVEVFECKGCDTKFRTGRQGPLPTHAITDRPRGWMR